MGEYDGLMFTETADGEWEATYEGRYVGAVTEEDVTGPRLITWPDGTEESVPSDEGVVARLRASAGLAVLVEEVKP